MSARYLLSLVAALVVSVQCNAAQPDIVAPDIELFNQSCAACHGDNGAGGRLGGPSLIAEQTRTLSDAEISTTIRQGRADKGMPEFGTQLRPRQITRLVATVRQLQGIKPKAAVAAGVQKEAPRIELPLAQREAIARGREAFQKRGRCSECHSVGIDGGRVAPELTLIAQRMNSSQIREAIVNPSLQIAKGYEVYEVVTIDGAQIRGWSRRVAPEAVQIFDPDEQLWTTYFFQNLQSHRAISESLMPAGLLEPLSSNEIDDLMIFLNSLK